MIITISYHNEATVKRSYEQLAKTIKDTPMQVVLLDNNYPLIKDNGFVYKVCQDLGFTYLNLGENIGSPLGYKYLLDFIEGKTNKVVTYDGDSFPITNGWNKALFDVLDSENVECASLQNDDSYRELTERTGYYQSIINGYSVRVVRTAVTNSICAYKMDFLNESCGLLELPKYYGGAECAMWNKMNHNKHLWVFLDDYKELRNAGELTDSIYTEFKYKYAHLQMQMSFEQYVLREDLHGNLSTIN